MTDKADLDCHSATLRLAYFLWEDAGRPDGRDQEFWDTAQRKMQEANHLKGVAPKPSSANEDILEASASGRRVAR